MKIPLTTRLEIKASQIRMKEREIQILDHRRADISREIDQLEKELGTMREEYRVMMEGDGDG